MLGCFGEFFRAAGQDAGSFRSPGGVAHGDQEQGFALLGDGFGEGVADGVGIHRQYCTALYCRVRPYWTVRDRYLPCTM